MKRFWTDYFCSCSRVIHFFKFNVFNGYFLNFNVGPKRGQFFPPRI